jgi:uncharacterized membrane protein
MNVYALSTLRAIHILSGALWVGAAFFNAAYLIPSIMSAGPAGAQVMRVMVQVRRLPVFMNAVMALTLLSGLLLYGWSSGGFRPAWITSNMGWAFTLGALLAFTTAGIGHFVTVPTVRKLGRLGAAIAAAGGPPSPDQAAEVGALQRRMLRAARLGSALIVLATILMAVARFL